jgi:hypothetical protein
MRADRIMLCAIAAAGVFVAARAPQSQAPVTRDERGVDCCQFDMVLQKRGS